MKALVTGGAGFIGGHVVRELLDMGWDVSVIDDLSAGNMPTLLREVAFTKGDIRSRKLVDQSLDMLGGEVDAVFHLAGLISVEESVKKPALYYAVNVTGTNVVLSASEKAGARAFVFASTAAAYGAGNGDPLEEDRDLNPESPYADTKVIGEEMVRQAEIPSICLRFFNAAGATPEHGLGEIREKETHLIPLAVRASMQGKGFQIYGGDYDTLDGTCIRDYVHVKDLAFAHTLAADRLLRGDGQDHTINLGSGCGYSVLEVLSAVYQTSKIEMRTHVMPRRDGDCACLVADIKKAKRMLGWEPKSSDLVKIVQDATDFAMLRAT